MKNLEKIINVDGIVQRVMQDLMTNYLVKLWQILDEKPDLKETFPAFILNPEKLLFYFGPNHLAIEYIGLHSKQVLDKNIELKLQIFNYTKFPDLMNMILGFKFDGTATVNTVLPTVAKNLFVPSNKASIILENNGWNFDAQPMKFLVNCAGIEFQKGKFSRLINCYFYEANNNELIVRHIKWMDIFPIQNIINDEKTGIVRITWPDWDKLIEHDSHYCFPVGKDFQEKKLTALNRFVELFLSSGITELDITKFLDHPDNQFILMAVFFSKEIHPEKECLWADGERKPIKPDFFVTSPNGYSDIVEFKLPTLKTSALVGKDNRKTFSAEINSYISQTRTYREYFEDPRNREYVLEKFGLNIRYPKRCLVIGRRWMLDSDEWKSLENDYKDLV